MLFRAQDEIETPVGIHHTTVVRWRDRRWKDTSGIYWSRKWRRVRAGHTPWQVFWIRSRDQYGRNALYSELIGSDDLFCSGLTFSPSDEPEAEDILDTILLAGLPIAFWLRQPHSEAQLGFSEVLRDRKVTDLPEVVRMARLQAFRENNELHVGRHLTLLWDDAERKLPGSSRPLAAPRIEGRNP